MLAASSILAVAQGLRFLDPAHCLDDAWISFRVARNLVEHGVLSFDPTQAPVEGMTNLLWTLLIAGWMGLAGTGDPIVMARIAGMVALLATVALVWLLAAHLARTLGESGALAGGVAALLVAANGNLAYYAMSGMETALWALLFTLGLVAVQAALDGDRGWRWAGAGLVLGLLAMTRPEGVLVGGLVLGAAALARPRRCWPALLVFGLLVGGMELFRWLYYGALVPNTFHAKPPDAGAGWSYLQRYLLSGIGLLAPLAALPALRRSRRARLLGVLILVLLAGVAWSGGDWMPGFRRCVLPSVGLALLAGLGAGLARRAWRPVVALGVLSWLAASGIAALRGTDAGAFPHQAMEELGRRVARTPGIEEVALLDIGRFGWAFDGAIFDLAGLTDAHIARRQGSHATKAWDDAYFRGRAPELILVRSESPVIDPLLRQPIIGVTERPLLLSLLDRGGWDYHGCLTLADGKYLLVFRRSDLELPETLWGPPSPKDLRQLLVEFSQRG